MSKTMLLLAEALIEFLEVSELCLAVPKFMVRILKSRGQVRRFGFQLLDALVEAFHLRRRRPVVIEEPLLPLLGIALRNVNFGRCSGGGRRTETGELPVLRLDMLLGFGEALLSAE